MSDDVGQEFLERLRQAQEIHAQAARVDPAAFMEFVLKDEMTGAPLEMAPMHIAWQGLMSSHRRLLLWSHTEGGKTNQVSIGRVLWELGRNPSARVVVISNTHEQAAKIVRTVAKYIESSAELAMVFPHLKKGDPWTSHHLFVQRTVVGKDPSLQACGIHGNIVGARIDLLIFDDILDYENCRTPAAREDLWKWIHATLIGRLTRDARVWIVGNAYHPDDSLHRFARQPTWTALRYPVMDAAGEPRWPERWPKDRIEQRRVELGPLEFARQMMCQARDDSESRFKQEWIDLCLERGRGHKLVPSLVGAMRGRVFTGVDLAVQKHAAAGRTVLFTIMVQNDGSREILNIEAGRWSAQEIVQRIQDTHHRYNSIVIVENNASQDFLVQFARGASAVPIRPFTTGRNKAHQEFGVESLAVELSNGKWVIPNDGGGVMHPEVAQWIQEMLFYSPDAHTGDTLMACVAPGALITTARGLVSIENVQTGDSVLTHRSRFRRVTGTTQREYNGHAVLLRPSGSPSVLVTNQHPVWSARAGFERADRSNRLKPVEWDWREAAELRAGHKASGMYVYAPSPEVWPDSASTRIDLAAFCGTRQLAWGGRWHISDDELSWRHERVCPRFLEVDEAFALFLGLYVAEGSCNGHQTNLALHARETHLADFAAEQGKRFGARTTIGRREGHGGMVVRLDAVLLARLCAMLGKRGGKAMPWAWMGWPLKTRLAVIRGWFMGDGHRARHPGGQEHLSAVSVARQWLEQVRLTLWAARFLPTMLPFDQPSTFQGKPCGHLPAWRLTLSETDSAKLLADAHPVERVHWGDASWQERERTNSRAAVCDAGAAIRLAEVELRTYTGPIYNLHVEEDESFVAAGIAVHNSWFAREGARMGSKKIESGRVDLTSR